jgi:hypothetical protein
MPHGWACVGGGARAAASIRGDCSETRNAAGDTSDCGATPIEPKQAPLQKRPGARNSGAPTRVGPSGNRPSSPEPSIGSQRTAGPPPPGCGGWRSDRGTCEPVCAWGRWGGGGGWGLRGCVGTNTWVNAGPHTLLAGRGDQCNTSSQASSPSLLVALPCPPAPGAHLHVDHLARVGVGQPRHQPPRAAPAAGAGQGEAPVRAVLCTRPAAVTPRTVGLNPATSAGPAHLRLHWRASLACAPGHATSHQTTCTRSCRDRAPRRTSGTPPTRPQAPAYSRPGAPPAARRRAARPPRRRATGARAAAGRSRAGAPPRGTFRAGEGGGGLGDGRASGGSALCFAPPQRQ